MKKILIVNESPVTKLMIKYSFFSEFNIIDAENVNSALTCLNNDDIDLFLLDLKMPEKDGTLLVKEIRKNPRYSNTPIIMLSQSSFSGINAWIINQNEVTKILRTIKSYI